MRTERPTCRECACTKVCEYFKNENDSNLDETCPLCYWEKYFVPKQEWISVDERLPDINDLCLLSMENRITKYRWIVIGYYHTNYDEYVTHWMPLPEAPKMKGGAE